MIQIGVHAPLPPGEHWHPHAEASRQQHVRPAFFENRVERGARKGKGFQEPAKTFD
jgi:hypothetical protein